MYPRPSAVCWGILLSLLLCSSIVPGAAAEDGVDPLLSIFPDSAAPTFFEKESETVLERGFRQWERNSHWHPDLDEQAVYLCRMQHRSVEERSWEIGIGKGGQIYSIVSSFGEAMPPQTPGAPWMDEAWQMTTIYEHLLGRDLHERTNDANSYVHQSGIYVRGEDARPFYSPMLAESFDPKRRAWSGVCWGQIPTASVNRSGVLIYANYRDMGAGVIELTWLTVNFEPEPLTNLGAWGGVRTSKFPEQVVSNPDGSYRYYAPFHYNYPGSHVHANKTGGWAAAVQNADEPHTHAIGVVFGKNANSWANQHRAALYSSGDSRHGTRDYTVQSASVYMNDHPGDVHLYRMYMILGTLKDVAEKANQLAIHATYRQMRIAPADSPRVALYPKKVGQSTVLTRTGEAAAKPLAWAWAWPVVGSKPLLLIRETQSGREFLTTDPYAGCQREPFANPLKPDDPSYQKYQDRTLYKAFAGKTEWVELLGFVLTEQPSDPATIPLSEVASVSDNFIQAEGVPSHGLYIIQGPNSE